MNKIQQIRDGQSISLYPGKNKVRKLWDIHKKQNGGSVNVRVYVNKFVQGELRYCVKGDIDRKRIGRARPQITVYPEWNTSRNRYEIGRVFIYWSYVY